MCFLWRNKWRCFPLTACFYSGCGQCSACGRNEVLYAVQIQVSFQGDGPEVPRCRCLLFMRPSPLKLNKINPLSLKTIISSQNIHFYIYKKIKIPRSLFKTTVSQHVKCVFSIHLKQKDERPKPWKLLKMWCYFPLPTEIKCLSLLPWLSLCFTLLLFSMSVSVSLHMVKLY